MDANFRESFRMESPSLAKAQASKASIRPHERQTI